jgi:hypothetical protein
MQSHVDGSGSRPAFGQWLSVGRGFGAAVAKTVAIEIAVMNLMKRMI